jgi:hypothetical protein
MPLDPLDPWDVLPRPTAGYSPDFAGERLKLRILVDVSVKHHDGVGAHHRLAGHALRLGRSQRLGVVSGVAAREGPLLDIGGPDVEIDPRGTQKLRAPRGCRG